MYHPTRGGVRGGRDQFTWESVKTDKDRECYLGHSIMAPVGRNNLGAWYAKETGSKKEENKEFLKAKELEEQALMAALGYRVIKKDKKEEKREEKEYSQIVKKEKIESKGPQCLEFNDKKELDKILLKLLNKYEKKELIEALGGKDRKGKKEKKKRNTNTESSSDSSRSDSESDTETKKRKSSKHNKKSKSKKKLKKSSISTSNESNSDSD